MKRTFALFLALMMVLSLAACGGGKSSSVPESPGAVSSQPSPAIEPTTLNLVLRGGMYSEVIKECLPAFESENNVKCVVQELSESDLYSSIALDAINTAGTYDLCMVDGSWMAEFTENGVLAELGEMG